MKLTDFDTIADAKAWEQTRGQQISRNEMNALLAGGPSSRWAKYECTKGDMDYYRVDLDEAVKIYEKRGTQ